MASAHKPIIGDQCEHCAADWAADLQPNTEAFGMSGELVCDECADAVFEDNGQFGVGA